MEDKNISSLYEKLQKTLTEDLRSHQDQNGKYLTHGEKSISRAELAREIEGNTDFGIELVSDAIMLAIDLIARGKEKPMGDRRAQG